MTITFFDLVELNDVKRCRLVYVNEDKLDLYAPNRQLDYQYKLNDIMDIDVRQQQKHLLVLALRPHVLLPAKPNNNCNNQVIITPNCHETDQPKPLIHQIEFKSGLIVLKIRFNSNDNFNKMMKLLLAGRIFEKVTTIKYSFFLKLHRIDYIRPRWREFELRAQLMLLNGWKDTKY